MRKVSGVAHRMHVITWRLTACVLGIPIVAFGSELTDPPKHPMDPLTAQEYSATTTILRDGNYVTDASRYSQITLHEPDKSAVLGWKT